MVQLDGGKIVATAAKMINACSVQVVITVLETDYIIHVGHVLDIRHQHALQALTCNAVELHKLTRGVFQIILF